VNVDAVSIGLPRNDNSNDNDDDDDDDDKINTFSLLFTLIIIVSMRCESDE